MKIAMPTKMLLIILFLSLQSASGSPIDVGMARVATSNWISRIKGPDFALANRIASSFTLPVCNGEGRVHVINLEGGGFVVTSADDELMPILAFSQTGSIPPSESSDGGLKALVEGHVGLFLNAKVQIDDAKTSNSQVRARLQSVAATENSGPDELKAIRTTMESARQRWTELLSDTGAEEEDFGKLMLDRSISDEVLRNDDDFEILVPPILDNPPHGKIRWNQETVEGKTCYNYYTTNHWPCGCVATAMAQIMRAYEYPKTSVAQRTFDCRVKTVTVNGTVTNTVVDIVPMTLKGGIYNWGSMPGSPDSSITVPQRQAIGKLTYDCGVSLNMEYSEKVSNTIVWPVADRLVDTFGYGCAKSYARDGAGIQKTPLSHMLLASLDANSPAILGVRKKDAGGKPHGGHAVVADGYARYRYGGRQVAVHVNVGWGEPPQSNAPQLEDAWYFLPEIDIHYANGEMAHEYKWIGEIVYNIFLGRDGTVLSGRLTDAYGYAVSDASVVLSDDSAGSEIPTTVDENGMYYFKIDLQSDKEYTVTATRGNQKFSKTVTVPCGKNETSTTTRTSEQGNYWGLDFEFPDPPPNDDFTNATEWVGIGGAEIFENINATQEPGEPNHGLGGLEEELGYVPSVWFKWTAPISRTMEINLRCVYAHSVAVYTGDSVDKLSLVSIAFGDFFTSDEEEVCRFDAVEGTTYHIAVVCYPEVSWLTGYIKWGEAYPLDDAVGLDVDTGAAKPWFGQPDVSVDGLAGASPPLQIGENSWLRLKKYEPGTLRFKVRMVGDALDSFVVHSGSDSFYWYMFGDEGDEWRDVTVFLEEKVNDQYVVALQYLKLSEYVPGHGAWVDCMEWNGPYYISSCFHTSFGTVYSDKKWVLPGKELGELPVAVYDGLVFDGWEYADGRVAKETDITGYSGLSLRALWRSPVTFDANGGVMPSDVPVYHVYKLYGDLPVPVREGYTFIGWYDARQEGNITTPQSYVSDKPKTLYAHWGPPIESVFHGPVSAVSTNPDTSSWWLVYKDSDGSNILRPGLLGPYETTWVEVEVAGPGRLSFDWRESSGNSSDPGRFYIDGVCQREIYGNYTIWATLDYDIPEGNHVLRWEISHVANTGPSYNYSLYLKNVHWKKNVEVKLNMNDGTGYSQTLSLLERYKYEGLPLPSREGCTFCGWYTEESGGHRVLPEDFVTADATELWARWSEVIPLERVFNGSGLVFKTGGDMPWCAQGGETSGADFAAQSGLIGHSQDSWIATSVEGPGDIEFNWKVSSESYSDNGVLSIDGVDVASISGTTRLWEHYIRHLNVGTHEIRWRYTKNYSVTAGNDCLWVDSVSWVPYIKVSFSPNGGNVDTQSKEVPIGGCIGPLPVPVRTGMVFLGWYEGGDSDVPVTHDSPAGDIDRTLLAKWAVDIAFMANEGVLEESCRSYPADRAYGEFPTPERTGYSFEGWFSDENCTERVEVDDIADGSVHVLYAKWFLNSYQVTFVLGEEDGVVTNYYPYGTKYASLPRPSSQKRIFVAWVGENGETVDPDAILPPTDLVLYAQWKTSENAVFGNEACIAHEGSSIIFRILGGSMLESSHVDVYVNYNTADSADVDLAKGVVDGKTPKGGLKFPQTLTWAKGEVGEKVIEIPVKTDKTVEGDEFLTLQLANPVGMVVGEVDVCTVTIKDANTYATLQDGVMNPNIKVSTSGDGKWIVGAGSKSDKDGSFGTFHAESPALAQGKSSTLAFGTWRGAGVFLYSVRFTGDPNEDVPSSLALYNGEKLIATLYHSSITNEWVTRKINATGSATATRSYKFVFTQGSDPDAHVEICEISWVANGSSTPIYAVNAWSQNTAGGYVSGAGPYQKGQTAKLAANPLPGWSFDGWYEVTYDENGENPSYEFWDKSASVSHKVTADINVMAFFSKIPYVRALADPADGGKVTGSGLCEKGKKVTLKATANKNFTFVGWTTNAARSVIAPYQDGDFVATTAMLVADRSTKPTANSKTSTTITNLTGDVTYYAVFKSDPKVTVFVEATDGKGDAPTGKGAGKYVAGTITGEGKYPPGKTKIALKAAANKNYVFSGWYEASGKLLAKDATYTIAAMPSNDVEYVAKFITTDDDKMSIDAVVDGWMLEPWVSKTETHAFRTNIWAGVYLEWPVTASALSEAKVKVAGLPAGLKFTDKPVTSKVGTGKTAVTVTNVPANTIYGAPTTASKIDAKTKSAKPSEVKLTVTTAGKSSQTYQIDTVVDALPTWAQGTFAGGWEPEDAATSGGQVSLTVDAKGKVSGKALGEGLTYTLAAPYYSAFALDENQASNFLADVTASWSYKEGTKTIKTNEVVQLVVQDNIIGGYAGVEDWFDAYTANWKVEPWKALGKKFDKATMTYVILADGTLSDDEKYDTVALGEEVTGRVTLKFAATGAVTIAGEFVSGAYNATTKKYPTVKATGSATLVPVDKDTVSVFIYLTPKGLAPHARCLDVPWPKE